MPLIPARDGKALCQAAQGHQPADLDNRHRVRHTRHRCHRYRRRRVRHLPDLPAQDALHQGRLRSSRSTRLRPFGDARDPDGPKSGGRERQQEGRRQLL